MFADAAAAEPLSWLVLPPAESFVPDWFVADWFDVADAVALCWVGALWTIACDCPSPPVCVAVALWVVLLSFCADDEALDSLVCSAPLPGSVESAAALPGARAAQLANKTMHATSPRQRLSPSPMS